MRLVADGLENVFLRREIKIDAGLRQPGLLRDRACPDFCKTLGHEQFFGRRHDLLAALLTRSLSLSLTPNRKRPPHLSLPHSLPPPPHRSTPPLPPAPHFA